MTTRLEEVRQAARTAAVHEGAAAQEPVGDVPQSPAVFESATGAAAGQAGLPMLSRDQPTGHDGAELEDRVEHDYLADRQLAHDKRQRRAGHSTAGSSFGRAAAAIDAAASSDETASESDNYDDMQDFVVNSPDMYGDGILGGGADSAGWGRRCSAPATRAYVPALQARCAAVRGALPVL
eukprot:COSAG01_NODE_2921_length_6846_cov_4.205276_8_plen_180_part_00